VPNRSAKTDAGSRHALIAARTFGVGRRLRVKMDQYGSTPFRMSLRTALLHESCAGDSPHDSSVIAGVHEQLDPYELQDQKLVTL
jgi:hypothetical protein